MSNNANNLLIQEIIGNFQNILRITLSGQPVSGRATERIVDQLQSLQMTIDILKQMQLTSDQLNREYEAIIASLIEALGRIVSSVRTYNDQLDTTSDEIRLRINDAKTRLDSRVQNAGGLNFDAFYIGGSSGDDKVLAEDEALFGGKASEDEALFGGKAASRKASEEESLFGGEEFHYFSLSEGGSDDEYESEYETDEE